jgi:hypothetical protein
MDLAQVIQEFELSRSHVGQSAHVIFRKVCDGTLYFA